MAFLMLPSTMLTAWMRDAQLDRSRCDDRLVHATRVGDAMDAGPSVTTRAPRVTSAS